MKNAADRPKQPFIDDDGRPRLRTAWSPHGPAEHRPGQAILDVVRYGGERSEPEAALERLSKDARTDLVASDVDLKHAVRSGFLRVTFDPDIDVTDILGRVNAGDGSSPKATGPVLFPNAVFRVGSFTADPMRFASGVGADPMRFASAYGADPMRFANSSTARPAAGPAATATKRAPGSGQATVAILDTGTPAQGMAQPFEVDFFAGIGTPLRERPDANADVYLDIAAGHTTFIRTIIERASSTALIMCEGVIHNDGDGDEADIALALERVFDTVDDKTRLLLNLSFSGYYDGDVEPPLIAFWILRFVAAGAVVVAAAGNNGACRKKFPAAMPEVVAVASLGPCGPSSFSNHGRWVDACVPGEDLVSGFFKDFDGAYEAVVPDSVPDIDAFDGWAMWSGTSFSTPTVVGALAEIIEREDCTATAAVDVLLHRPGLFRLPDYGIVVNRVF